MNIVRVDDVVQDALGAAHALLAFFRIINVFQPTGGSVIGPGR